MTASLETYEDHIRAIADAESAHSIANERMQEATHAEARAATAVSDAWSAWRTFTRAQTAEASSALSHAVRQLAPTTTDTTNSDFGV